MLPLSNLPDPRLQTPLAEQKKKGLFIL